MKRTALLLILLLAFPAIVIAAPPSDQEAVAFMSQVVATYKSLSSYRDRGRSVQTLKSDSSEKNPSTVVIDFTTLFKRPNKFRFSWTRTENLGDGPYISEKNAIWSDGTRIWSFAASDSTPIAEESFAMAVAGATGVSQGTALHIFRLLTDDVHGFRFDQLRKLKIVRSEILSGIDCYVVQGSQYDMDNYELWIGKQDHLIRKGIDTQSDGNTASFERSGIVVNKDIADNQFREN